MIRTDSVFFLVTDIDLQDSVFYFTTSVFFFFLRISSGSLRYICGKWKF